MKKKITKIILASSTGLIVISMILFIAIMMIFDFFGGEISDTGYIEGNIDYASEYKSVVNKNITKENNGYVSLRRLLYFQKENENLSFNSIYKSNLDYDLKTMKPISDVCVENYRDYFVCSEEELKESNELDEYSYRPFNSPIDFINTTITSFFGEERYVFETFSIHYAWDIGAPAKTNVYSVGEGKVKTVRFNQDKNETNKDNGAGNYIEIEYEIEDKKYIVLYGHLYPKSNTVKVGDQVRSFQKIAEVGTTGYSTGNHLHFQVSVENNKIDGMNLIDFTKESYEHRKIHQK